MKRFRTAALIAGSVLVLSALATADDERAVDLTEHMGVSAIRDLATPMAAGWKVRWEEDHDE